MSDREQDQTLHCECGSEEYLLKWNYDGDRWAVCADCGRPTKAIGNGYQKEQEWLRRQE